VACWARSLEEFAPIKRIILKNIAPVFEEKMKTIFINLFYLYV
jgi:hypothetical protein